MTYPNAYQLTNIRHYYGSTCILNIENLNIARGSITGLIGPNGSGKSTLLKLLAFAMSPSHGSIFYNGKKEICFSPSVRSKITLLTQTPYLLKRTVYENIIYGLKIRKDTRDMEDRAKTALLDVGLDYDKFARRKWHELSGGETQRVAMAARLILKPEVLLLDEPVASVDTQSAELIRTASLNARDRWGTTLIIASHDLQWMYSITDSQLSISNGYIFDAGTQNIITGPFEDTNGETVIKRFEDGQGIILRKPPPQKNVQKNMAIIQKDSLIIETKGKEQSPAIDNLSANLLSGQVKSMLLEEKNNQIFTQINVQDLSFTIKLSADQVASLNLYPGKAVVLKFSPDDVAWI